MDDLAGLKEKLDAFDKLLQALLPFVSPSAQKQIGQLRHLLEPFSRLQEIMEMMEVMNAMQEMSSAFSPEKDTEDGPETETHI